MILLRCYRDGGREVFVITTASIVKGMSEQALVDLCNAMATGPADPNITMVQQAHQTATGVFEF